MARLRLGGRMKRTQFSMNGMGLAVAAVMLVVAGFAAPASAGSLSPDDQKCLACHQTEGLEKQLPNGEKLSLHITGDAFAKSVHGAFGCATCHSDIDLAKHPGDVPSISSKRSFSIVRTQVCAGCHSDKFDEWKHSVHAALVQEGNPLAPVCTSCHSPHTMIKGAAATMDTVPCKACHADIFTAYSTSVHGMLRSAGVTQAPLCFSCHGAHSVRVPTANQGMKDVCLGCHKEALVSHQKWLPNAQLHFEAITCPACHSPTAHRTVDLVLFDTTTHKDASRPIGVPEFELSNVSHIAGHAGMDSATLFKLLQTLNRPGSQDKMSVKGRLDVLTGAEAHKIAPSSEAISDCKTCHQAGAKPFQSVTISVASPSGIPIRFGVNKEVLNSAVSISSIGGFYAIGGTRITILDVLLVLALLGGIGGSMAHWGLRWISQRRRAQHDKRKE